MQPKPNVILITTDQQRKDSLGCYGSDFVTTPNLDKMAEQGILFNRAYCTSPVCTPSRATIYTGSYASEHGAWNIGMNVPKVQPFLSECFQESGYKTHLIGKAHFNAYNSTSENSKEPDSDWENHFRSFHGPYYGFDQVELTVAHTLGGVKGHYGLWVKDKSGKTEYESVRKAKRSFGGEAYDWDLPMELHNNSWIVERTKEFLKDSINEKNPFFLSIGFQDPHHPHAVPKERVEEIQPEKIPLPKYNEGELDDKPPHFQSVREGRWNDDALKGNFWMSGQASGFDYRNIEDQDAKLGKAYYYKMVEMVDEAMGEILLTLDNLGLSENTIVVFTSDHGELLGDHGIWMKGPFHYEQLVNVPLLIQWKNHLPAGKKINSINSLVDIAPSLLSLCEIPIPNEWNGLDCSQVWIGNLQEHRERALIEYVDEPQKLRLKTIITARYKLTYYSGESYGELYDLQDDPGELKNLYHDSSYQEIKQNLLMNLLDEIESTEMRAHRYTYA
ncbi:sulfatase family protein [Lederbergia panacisoli]|uniref:sulfatase family protein n=1 Tax=Lederbergia panacisoli TaxID=1255251 RepID=UPI00214BB654|nr:sulfatase-like hydrolase/transferase [Lederbergia panacisoli]MCR2822984.1 sulfatase-like hydrolase/transferase [Lederbergia panacisoli]